MTCEASVREILANQSYEEIFKNYLSTAECVRKHGPDFFCFFEQYHEAIQRKKEDFKLYDIAEKLIKDQSR